MDEREHAPEARPDRAILTVRLEQHGPGTLDTAGTSRRLGRPLSETELASLNAQLRAAVDAYLSEIGALSEDEPGWAEALENGSWVWRGKRPGD